jgi:hypothetical protein
LNRGQGRSALTPHRAVAMICAALGLGACSLLSPLDYLSDGPPKDAGVPEAAIDGPLGGNLPVAIAMGQNLPGAIAIDDDTIYWANAGSGAIMAMKKDGSVAAHALATKAGSNPTATAVFPGAGSVYWVGTSAGTVQGVDKGGALDAGLLASNQSNPASIAVDSQFVYWANRTDDDGGGGQVEKVPKGGGASSLVYDDSQGDPSAIRVDGTNVYVSDFVDLSIIQLAKNADGGSMVTYGSGVTEVATPAGFAIDENAFYFCDPDGQIVGRLVKSTVAQVQTIADTQDGPTGIAVDATYVYWTNFGSGTVMRALKTATGTPELLAEHQAGPSSIAVDAQALYWTNLGGGTDGAIMKLALAKP